jgi:hypothetical protein
MRSGTLTPPRALLGGNRFAADTAADSGYAELGVATKRQIDDLMLSLRATKRARTSG